MCYAAQIKASYAKYMRAWCARTDRADRLTSTSGGTGNESYFYDGHGRRVRIERANNAKTYQVYSKDGQLLHELGADGQMTNYVYLNGSLVALRLRAGSPDAGEDIEDGAALQ